MTKNTKIGIALLITPPILIIGTPMAFGLLNALLSKGPLLAGINYALSVLGVIGMVSLVVCIPLGIYFLCKKEVAIANLKTP